jgi:hypothetical protein
MSVAAAALTSCSRCNSPLEQGDLRCAVCALPVPALMARVERAHVEILRCTECGAAIAFDANKQAPSCGFCSATMRIEQPVDPVEVATRRVPFAVDRETATAALRGWLSRRGFFAPKTLRDEAVVESLTPLCWAAWVVDARALVTWTADSDAGSGRSDWAPHAGQVAMTFDNLCIAATRGLDHREQSQLTPSYDLGRAVAVATEVPGEEPAMIESFDAQRSAARHHIAHVIDALAAQRVECEIPGRRFRNIHVSCLLESLTTERVALPAWVLAYRYRGSPYRAVIHGQRPDLVLGSSPIAWGKVMSLVIGILAGLFGLVVVYLLLRHGR